MAEIVLPGGSDMAGKKLEEMRSIVPDRRQKRVRRLMKKHLPPESL